LASTADENMFTFLSASLADENNSNIFVGHLADENTNTGHATSSAIGQRKYWDPV
jgi:hypothetical protein